jgi:hypothetical protein
MEITTYIRRLRVMWPARYPVLALMLAVGISALHVTQWVGARPFWLDEEMIALNLRGQTMVELARGLWLDQSAPFGWLAIERVLLLVFGDGERTLRVFPLLSGLATLGAALWVGRRWMDSAGALCLVALVGGTQWLAFYVHQLKPYSGDVLWGLLLPALGAWVAEAGDEAALLRRLRVWWLTAAAAHWLALGALFVTPGCGALLLVLASSRVRGRALAYMAAPVAIWGASFAALYVITLAPASGNPGLQAYWAFALPPPDASALETARWLIARFEAIAVKPGGASLPWLFWGLACVGWLRACSVLSAMMVVPAITATCLAVAGILPMFERLSLWVMPGVMVGIAQAATWALSRPARRWLLVPRAAVVLGIVTLLTGAVPRGLGELTHPPTTSHSLDDRGALAWLLTMRRPGSVIITTELSQPAVWWYGNATLSDPNRGRALDVGTPILRADFRATGRPCAPPPAFPGNQLLVYLGFRFDDVPPGFDQALFETLATVGTVRMLQDFAGVGRAAVVEVGIPSPAPQLSTLIGPTGAHAAGCVTFAPAERW